MRWPPHQCCCSPGWRSEGTGKRKMVGLAIQHHQCCRCSPSWPSRSHPWLVSRPLALQTRKPGPPASAERRVGLHQRLSPHAACRSIPAARGWPCCPCCSCCCCQDGCYCLAAAHSSAWHLRLVTDPDFRRAAAARSSPAPPCRCQRDSCRCCTEAGPMQTTCDPGRLQLCCGRSCCWCWRLG